jgi:hypothetical protein
MDHFGDKISVRVIENLGEKGTATVHEDPTPFLDKHTGEEYKQLRAQALERLEDLKNDGHLDDDRGQAIYKAAKAGTTPIATPHGQGNIDGSSNRSEESVERKSSGSELRSSLLEKPAAPKPVEKLSPSPSETDSTYREQVKAAKGRSQRGNVARSSPQVVDADPRKAVVLDADSLGAWHRTFGEEGKFAGADDMGHTSVHIVGANF